MGATETELKFSEQLYTCIHQSGQKGRTTSSLLEVYVVTLVEVTSALHLVSFADEEEMLQDTLTDLQGFGLIERINSDGDYFWVAQEYASRWGIFPFSVSTVDEGKYSDTCFVN